jgi:hypothetical protein
MNSQEIDYEWLINEVKNGNPKTMIDIISIINKMLGVNEDNIVNSWWLIAHNPIAWEIFNIISELDPTIHKLYCEVMINDSR